MTLSILILLSWMKRSSACSGDAGPPSREMWITGLWCLCASSMVFFEPPVRTGAMEKTTVPSLSRTFHSVRWT
jgi:hypothetical protein